MLPPEIMQLLRCPADAKRNVPLEQTDTHLVCTQCKLRFRIRDGIPNLLIDDAELPEGCASLRDLPCRKGAIHSGS
jgi:uncharacterized protein YbaR (Trm112 family)